MKSFFTTRQQFDPRSPRPQPGEMPTVLMIELGFWDMVRLLFGREIATHSTVIRAQLAYDAFNLAARPAEPSGYDGNIKTSGNIKWRG